MLSGPQDTIGYIFPLAWSIMRGLERGLSGTCKVITMGLVGQSLRERVIFRRPLYAFNLHLREVERMPLIPAICIRNNDRPAFDAPLIISGLYPQQQSIA